MLKEKIDSNYLYQKQYLNNLKRNIVLEKIKIIFYKYYTTLEILNQYKKHTGKKNVKELNMFSKYLILKIKELKYDKP